MDSPFGSQCDYIKENEMSHTKKGDRIMQGERIRLDIAKSSFQVHGVRARGKVGVRKQLSRSKVLLYFAQPPPCRIGLEACGGAHYWARARQNLWQEVRLTAVVRDVVEELRERRQELHRRITDYDHRIEQLAKQNEATRRLMQVEGVGPITATAIVATIGNGHAFQHGRQFAAWVGLVPKQHSTGGKTVLGRITKQGNVYLR